MPGQPGNEFAGRSIEVKSRGTSTRKVTILAAIAAAALLLLGYGVFGGASGSLPSTTRATSKSAMPNPIPASLEINPPPVALPSDQNPTAPTPTRSPHVAQPSPLPPPPVLPPPAPAPAPAPVQTPAREPSVQPDQLTGWPTELQPQPSADAVPSFEITLDLDMVSVDADRPTFENQFTADIAHLLHLDPTGVNIIDIEPGSVIVTCSFVGLDQEQILNALHAPNTVIAGAAVLGLHPVSDPTREQLAITRACVGSFSACSANCESTYTVAVPASGGGSECAETDGSLQSCAPGDGDCPQICRRIRAPLHGQLGTCGSSLEHGATCEFACDVGYLLSGLQPLCTDGDLFSYLRPPPLCVVHTVDCIGAFSACSANCESTYTVAVPPSGGGSECAETDGSLQSCAPGDGDCPSPEPMSGPDLSLPHQLSAALPSSGNLSQYMPDPEAPASFRVEIVTDLPDSVPIVLQVSKPA